MEQQYSMFSKELEEQIAKTVLTIVTNSAVEENNKGGKRYFKKKDFCKELGISFNTLQSWITKGLSTCQVGGISLIDMRDAEKFLQDHKI